MDRLGQMELLDLLAVAKSAMVRATRGCGNRFGRTGQVSRLPTPEVSAQAIHGIEYPNIAGLHLAVGMPPDRSKSFAPQLASRLDPGPDDLRGLAIHRVGQFSEGYTGYHDMQVNAVKQGTGRRRR